MVAPADGVDDPVIASNLPVSMSEGIGLHASVRVEHLHQPSST